MFTLYLPQVGFSDILILKQNMNILKFKQDVQF